MRSKTAHSLSPLLLIATVPILLGARGPCDPPMPLGADEDAGVDASTPTGDASRPADAGTSIDSGITPDATVPPVDGGDPAVIDLSEAAHACGMLSACLHGQVWTALCVSTLAVGTTPAEYRDWMTGRGVTRFEGVSMVPGVELPPNYGFIGRSEPFVLESIVAEPARRSCLVAAGTCGDVYACLGEGAPSATCDVEAGSNYCDGSSLRACLYSDWDFDTGFPADIIGADPIPVAVDCTDQGNACVTGTDFSTEVHGCAPSPCDQMSFSTHCDGNVGVECNLGIVDRTACPTDTVCQVQGAGDAAQAVCVGTGAPCDTATTPPSCDGNTLVQCRSGAMYRQGCDTTAGLSCRETPSGAMCALGDECSIAELATCDGATLVTCAAGRELRIDCTALGFTSCGRRSLWDSYCQ